MTNIDDKIDLKAVNEIIAQNIERIYDHLSIQHKVFPNRVTCTCPVHGGTKDTSLCVFTEGESRVGNIVCWTHHCESDIGSGAINLICYLMKLNIREAVQWIEEFLKCKIDKISEDIASKRKFITAVKNISLELPKHIEISRDYIKQSLLIPSTYFMMRGFSEKVLVDNDVGYCNKRDKQMYLRHVVPVYNNGDKYIGAVARTTNPECLICGTYHAKNRMCPTNNIEKKWSAKWINSEGFFTGDYLYNLSNATNHINDKRSIVIVEGPLDCWRLIESGVHNTVALFGCNLTDKHKFILEYLNIHNLFLALDDDDSGNEACEKIEKSMKRYYNVTRIKPTRHDIGEMSVSETQKLFSEYNLL